MTALALGLASAAAAEMPTAADSATADAPNATPVSTPPQAPTAASLGDAERDPADALPARPLTRAATRERIDAMSPVEWLSRYGHVVVGGSS